MAKLVNNNYQAPPRVATPRARNRERKRQQRLEEKQNRLKQGAQPTVMMGPYTRERRKKYTTPPYNNPTPGRDRARGVPKLDPKGGARMDRAVAESLAMRRLLIAIDIVLIVAFLVQLFPFNSILSIVQRVRDGINATSMRPLAAASPLEEAALGNPAMQAVIKYAQMASLPFLLFVPALIMVCATILSVTEDDASNSVQSISDRKKGRKRVLSLMSVCTGMLFAFLTILIACAEASRWILLGVMSFVTPAILMMLAELSVVYGGASSGVSHLAQGWSWRRQVDVTAILKLIGFTFVFLPFIAGFFYAISPPYLLAVPLSSLTTCSLAGLFGVLPFIAAVIFLAVGWKASFWALTKLFHAYSWMVNRHCSTLLFLTCVALLTAMLELRFPSYL